ncbi:hypothetical protein ACKLNO_10050 [Neisseriaceae bacterium B1]
MNNPSLEQLESRVHALVEKINKLRADNHRLHDELALSRQDFEVQAKELEAVRNQPTPVASLAGEGDDELRKTLEHQTQEIQLLEKERLNLRDQIAFLQNTIQNKEKDWKDKADHVRLELDAQLQDKQQQLLESQERVSNLELKLQVLQTDAEQVNSAVEEQKSRVAEVEGSLNAQLEAARLLEEQLEAAKKQLQEQQEVAQTREVEQKSQFETKLAQEAERFRIEYALLGKQHEQNLSDLTQALNQQKERLREETADVQAKLQQALAQNQAYRALLAQNAADIRALLSRLPEPDLEKIEGDNP